VEWVDGEVIFVCVEDRGCDGESFFEAALGEEEFGFGKEEIGVVGEVVMGGEGF